MLACFPGGPTTDHPCSLPASPEASDADDVVRRLLTGVIGPAKNGDAFGRLGTMTTLADRKGIVKGCDILS